MNRKVYKVEHMPTESNVVVEIDFDYKPKRHENITEAMEEVITFFSGGRFRLSENNGNVLETFLCQLTDYALKIAIGNNYNEYGIINEIGESEGYFPVDGSEGILILSVEQPTFDTRDELNVTEQKPEAYEKSRAAVIELLNN